MDLKFITDQFAKQAKPWLQILLEIRNKVTNIDHWVGKWAETQIRPEHDRPLRVEISMGELFDHAEQRLEVEWSPWGLIITENKKVLEAKGPRLLVKHFCRPQI